MSTNRIAGILLVLAGLAVPARPAADITSLAWLEGRWTGTHEGVEMEEYWTSTAGGAMVGLHKDVKAGRMIAFEYLRIGPDDTQALAYYASPRGLPATAFRLKEMSERRVVFENKAHDFPQRILYWLDADGALHARIEGNIDGTAAGQEWTWRRPTH